MVSNERGQTFISDLIAAALITVVFAGVISLSVVLVRETKRSQLLNMALTTQGDLIAALTSKETYNGLGPAAGLRLLNGSGQVIGILGQRVYLDRSGQRCQVGTVTADCAITTDVDVSCGGTTEAPCMAAYRVTVWPEGHDTVKPAPLGAFFHGDPAKVGASSFVKPADYSVPISYDFFAQQARGSCSVGAQNILITGLNRTTGEVSCVSAAATPCAEGTIAKTITAVNGRLEMTCVPLKVGTCPTDYVWQGLKMNQLDPTLSGDSSAHGTCVYRWLDGGPWEQPWPTVSTSDTVTVNEQFCNSDVYTAQGTGSCTAAIDSDVAGLCTTSCPPCGPGGCATCQTASHSSVTTDGGSTNGASASCTLTITDSCGSHMTAHPVWAGTCRTIQRALEISI